MESYTLYQLNEYIRRVIALNFREPLWIEAELIQVKESRGNWYLELVEKKENSEEIIAQSPAAIWYRNFQFVKKKLGDVIFDLLKAGTQVRIKCTVDFNERYGLKLLVQDIDPNYTFGRLEMNRQKVIERLQKEGLMDLNSSLQFPPVLQSVAIISSSKAAGYQDFMSHLNDNIRGYRYALKLFETSVQGRQIERETIAAIKEISQRKDLYDAAVIIRGGGSKLDLGGYDSYGIAKEIAQSGVPFITGIGHDVDQTVCDMVSCLPLKTPTAVADYLIEHNLMFESELESMVTTIFQHVRSTLHTQSLMMQSFGEQIKLKAKSSIDMEGLLIQRHEEKMTTGIRNLIQRQDMELSHYAVQLDASDPLVILSKGYAYISHEHKSVKSIKDLRKDQIVDIHLQDGSRSSKII